MKKTELKARELIRKFRAPQIGALVTEDDKLIFAKDEFIKEITMTCANICVDEIIHDWQNSVGETTQQRLQIIERLAFWRGVKQELLAVCDNELLNS